MEHGGKRKGAGRKAGAITTRSRTIAEGALKDGLTPLEYMLQLMRDENKPVELRAEMAKAAAPYVHPRLATVEVSGKDGGPIAHSLNIEFVGAK